MAEAYHIAVTKAKKTLEVDIDKLSDKVLREVITQGLKVLLNRGASKVTAANIPDKEERESEAMKIAEAQLELVYTEKIRFTGGKAKKTSGAVNTEAMRIARNMVKDGMKKIGLKISHVKASEITAAAKELLEASPEIIQQAEANLEERAKAPMKIDLKSLIHEDPELVKKAEAKKKPLSAKQAGMTVKHKSRSQQAQA